MLDALRLAEHIHGHLGWLSAALLVHPAILLRHRTRRADLAVGLACGVPTGTAALGVWLYGGYREHLKQQIFLTAPSIGLLFERKEHLAFGAIMLAWAGSAAYFAAPRATSDATRLLLRTTAFRAFIGASGLAIVTAILGTIVATYKTF